MSGMMRRRRLTALLMAVFMVLSLLAVVPASARKTEAATGSKLVAFAFDDGPSPNVPALLDGLKARNAHVTFFMVGSVASGNNVTNQMSVMKRMVEEGHQLGNHTWSHNTRFSSLSAASMQSEVNRVTPYLYQAMGGSYRYMVRTPGGSISSAVNQAIEAPIILWDSGTADYNIRNASKIYSDIIGQLHDGCIVCMHDRISQSCTAALQLIDTLQSEGYEIVTVAELFRRKGVTPQNHTTYRRVNGATIYDAYKTPELSTSVDPSTGGIRVTMTAEQGVTIHYTTDGTYPTLASSTYTGPVTFTQGTTVTAVGYDEFGTRTPSVTKEVVNPAMELFNADYYAAKNPDLASSCGSDRTKLTEHFLAHGLAEGRDFSPVFSWKYYKEHYPDLAAQFGDSVSGYLNHFLSTGMAEGRKGCGDFDVWYYRWKYPDLKKAYGNDLKKYYLHYIRSGWAEGRSGMPASEYADGLFQVGEVKDSAVYRLYNAQSGEHLYTMDANERNVLTIRHDWSYEGISWNDAGSATGGAPVYRVYNPASGEHHYTTDANERAVLVSVQHWKDEGVAWYSDPGRTVPVYRLYHRGYGVGGHMYTKDAHERDVLKTSGWNDEGIGWYTA